MTSTPIKYASIDWNERFRMISKWQFYLFTIRHSLPWDQTTPFGYFMEMCVSLPFGAAYYIINGTLLILFVSICLHHQAFYEMFSYSVNSLQVVHGHHIKKKILNDLVRFHIAVKEWVQEFLTFGQNFTLEQNFKFSSLILQLVFRHRWPLQSNRFNTASLHYDDVGLCCIPIGTCKHSIVSISDCVKLTLSTEVFLSFPAAEKCPIHNHSVLCESGMRYGDTVFVL